MIISIYLLPDTKISKKTPQQSSSLLQLLNYFQRSKSWVSRFGNILPDIRFENILNFELSRQIYIKIKEFEFLLSNQQFLIDYRQNII